MTVLIDPHRLVKLCGMFGSDHDGEVSNAARMADKLVRGAGLTWADVIKISPAKPPPDWRDLRAFCARHAYLLSTKERAFIIDLASWRCELTPRQRDWLEAIHARLQREAA